MFQISPDIIGIGYIKKRDCDVVRHGELLAMTSALLTTRSAREFIMAYFLGRKNGDMERYKKNEIAATFAKANSSQ